MHGTARRATPLARHDPTPNFEGWGCCNVRLASTHAVNCVHQDTSFRDHISSHQLVILPLACGAHNADRQQPTASMPAMPGFRVLNNSTLGCSLARSLRRLSRRGCCSCACAARLTSRGSTGNPWCPDRTPSSRALLDCTDRRLHHPFARSVSQGHESSHCVSVRASLHCLDRVDLTRDDRCCWETS